MTLCRLPLPWIDPLAAAWALREREDLLALISDGGPLGRISWVAAGADSVFVGRSDERSPFARLRGEGWDRGVVCLAAYDLGARPATGERGGDWPDLMLARYPSLLRFDHGTRTVEAIGLGADAARRADRARAWWAAAAAPAPALGPLASSFDAEAPPEAYLEAVADVVGRIAAGELFQANIARAWRGELNVGAAPLDLLVRLGRGRAAPYGAYLRLGERALASNSPELFLTLNPDGRRVETRPIKGTRPRAADPREDARLARELAATAKDRAENLMIVDLMRNDLSRVAAPGSVRVERLFEVESHPTVHHLVSTVAAKLARGMSAPDLLEAAFPPGSITGAPKHQAMKVIAAHEPPRGPWCGSLIWLDERGALTSSVLIRTAAFAREAGRWRFRAQAGAGIVADSRPRAELEETDAKIRALREALTT